MPATDSNGLSDPYVKLDFCGQKKKTKVAQKTLYPEFYETFVFDNMEIPYAEVCSVYVCVFCVLVQRIIISYTYVYGINTCPPFPQNFLYAPQVTFRVYDKDNVSISYICNIFIIYHIHT